MADDDGPAPGGPGGIFQGPPIAGMPRGLVIGGVVIGGAALIVWWWKKHQAAKSSSSSTSTVITGSSSTSLDNAMLDAILKNWQQHPASSSTSTTSGGGSAGGAPGTGGGAPSTVTTTGSGTQENTATIPANSPATSTQESGNMHGISLAQALYLFDTGNQPYTYNPATGQYTRWSGTPVSGQTYYSGPLNWQDALKNGAVTGGTKGHPITSSSSTTAKPKPKTTPVKKK